MILLRNNESHFSQSPSVDIGRSRFEVPFNHTFDMNFGNLVPFFWQEILPGDSVSLDTSKVIRTSTLLDPVMGNAYFDVYYFFIPMRLVWDHAREFFGENTSGPWYPQTTYTIPQLKTDEDHTVLQGSILDHLGIPPGISGLSFSALPVRSYNLVWSEWFRDQNVQNPANVYKGDADQLCYGNSDYGATLRKVCKLHDYFTSCLPGPQRGPDVSFALADSASVSVPAAKINVTCDQNNMHSMYFDMKFSGSANTDYNFSRWTNTNGPTSVDDGANGQAWLSKPGGAISPYTQENMYRSNLVANYPGSSSVPITGINSVTVNELRMAFAMQKFYEKGALYGGRYVEFLKSHFGVTSPDARLQRTEYLGGNRVPINVQQVEQTSSGETPLGHLGAFSHTSDVNSDFTHSFVEHGILLGVCCARVNRVYAQGIAKKWSRKTVWEFYDPLFANLGNSPVYRKEIFASGSDEDNNVFGFQEAWADYRYSPDRVSGCMRPQARNSLASWNYADYYLDAPILSSDWIEEDKNVVDRTLAVTSAQSSQLIVDIHVDEVMVRPMPVYSIPGLIDHH